MRGLLVRVGIDKTFGGWNAPCRADGSFCYVPMKPKKSEVFEQGIEKTTYNEFEKACQIFAQGTDLVFPKWLHGALCHLDPDFRFLSYGDSGQRANRISTFFDGSRDNFIAFYASFKPIDFNNSYPLVYAIIGLYRFQGVKRVRDLIMLNQREKNAHTRLADYREDDIVIFADKNKSGRLRTLIQIGKRNENRHYYVKEQLLKEWGGISSTNGWIQRSAYLPEFCKPDLFLQWLEKQNPKFVHENNIVQ
jgi:hypothetical protein